MALLANFYKQLNQTSKTSLGWKLRISELPRVPGLIVVNILKPFDFIHPVHVVLAGFLCLILAGTLMIISYETYASLASVLIIIGMVLDYADGQLARATNRVSSVGALCDLAADFISSAFLFFSIAVVISTYYEGNSKWLALLTVLSLISHYILVSCWSYLAWRIAQPNQKSKIMKEEFHKLPINDYKEGKYYQEKFFLLRLFFDYTWGITGKIATSLPIWRERSCSENVFNLMSISAIGIQLTLLAGFIFIRANLLYFLYFQIIILTLLITTITLSERYYEKSNAN